MPKMLAPAPVFFEERKDDASATAEILFIGERESPVSLSIRSPLSFCLDWTGPNNPLHPDVWNERGGLGKECDEALKRPWLLLLRVAESRLPRLLRMEAFLIYVPSWIVVGSFPLAVYGQHDESDLGQGPWVEESQSMVSTAFFQAMNCELSMNLAKMPNASFHFDNRECSSSFSPIAMPASHSTVLVPMPRTSN